VTAFDYLLPLVAILIGLAIGDLVTSLHRIVRARARVQWHWFPFAGALLALLLALEVWWGLRNFQTLGLTWTIGAFLPFVLELVLMFLLACVALPDEVAPEGVSLRAYYFEQHSYFWSLFAALIAVFALHRIGLAWAFEGTGAFPAVLWNLVPNAVLIAAAVSLALVRAPWWHGLWLALLPVVYLAALFDRPLG
jgi:hypothetical protein